MPKPFENPLTPNKRLKQLYEAMVTLRLQSGLKRPALEAVHTAPTLLLHDTPGDHLVTPEKRHPLLHVFYALGLAESLKATQNIALIYLAADLDLKPILQQALARELPVVFLALPGKTPGAAQKATKLGVPGIPVDSADSIALYRVAQESFVRARAGGGPALIEPILFPRPDDPIALLARQLIARRIVTPAWLTATEARLRTRAAKPERPGAHVTLVPGSKAAKLGNTRGF